MKAYHVTNENYPIGKRVSLSKELTSKYYEKGTTVQKDTNDFFDEYIDRYHPDYTHRRSALFAFESLSAAKQFCRAEGAAHIYEVEFEVSYKGPFVLVNTLMNNLDNPSKCEIIAREYFTPNQLIDNGNVWYTYELVGSSFTVTGEIEARAEFSIGFLPDYEKSERLFGNPKKGTHGLLA